MADDGCANCCGSFTKRERGYSRFALERQIPGSAVTARQALENISKTSLTPVKSRKDAKFLCAVCWAQLCQVHKYQRVLKSFSGKTQEDSYVGRKLQTSSLATGNSPSTSTQHEREAGLSHISPGEFASPITSWPMFTSTPKVAKHSRREIFPLPPGHKPLNKWDRICRAIKNRQYSTAFRGLYRATKGTQKHFQQIVGEIVRREMRNLINKETDFPLCRGAKLSNMDNFSWDSTLNHFETSAPMLYSVLKSSITRGEEGFMRGTRVNMKPRFGNILGNILHARSPRKASFLPTVVSIQLWRGGLKRETMKQLSRLGCCIGYNATLAALDRVRAGYDATAKECKVQLEKQLSSPGHPNFVPNQQDLELSMALSTLFPAVDDEEYELSDEEVPMNLVSDDEVSELSASSDDESEDQVDEVPHEEETDESIEKLDDTLHEMEQELPETKEAVSMDISDPSDPDELHPGFTTCWDNVGKKVTSRHPGPDSKNVYMNWALGYIAINRIPVTHLDVAEVKRAQDLPPSTFIPEVEDFQELRQRMQVIVGRMICRHLAWFAENMSHCVTKHMIHPYSNESAGRTVLVNLGIFKENPSTTQGAIGIYEKLQKYIPNVDGRPFPTIVYGDGLSCERGNDAMRARANGNNAWERLEGFEPAAQEFHKEMILLQDYYDEYFKGGSSAECGTLAHIRNIFNFRQVKRDIGDNVTHAWELMCLITEGYICALAMKILQLPDKSSKPASAPKDVESCDGEEKQKYLESVSSKVVSYLWHETNTVQLMDADEGAPTSDFCICGNDNVDDVIVQCSMRSQCSRGEYFHASCVGLDIHSVVGNDWFCCDTCRGTHATIGNQYPWCTCGTDLGPDEPMLGCDAEEKCTKKEWYHLQCLGMAEEDIPRGKWYCSASCKKSKQKRQKTKHEEDYKMNCVRAMTWQGLNLLARRDAVREGDGDAMMSHWKIDLLHFYARRHPKYVILAHRLMAAISGWQCEKIVQELKWNRTINYSGGIGRNLPADLMNEILNRLFKEQLQGTCGRYTDDTISRCSQVIGPIGEALDAVFDDEIVEKHIYRHRRRANNRDTNVAKFLKIIPSDVFECMPGRQFRSFPDYVLNNSPRNPEKFLPKMKQLSKKLDILRQNIIHA